MYHIQVDLKYLSTVACLPFKFNRVFQRNLLGNNPTTVQMCGRRLSQAVSS